MSSPEISPDRKDNPFDIQGVKRKDLCVVTYWCPKGCEFDRVVNYKNLGQVTVWPCINHPSTNAWIHESRDIR